VERDPGHRVGDPLRRAPVGALHAGLARPVRPPRSAGAARRHQRLLEGPIPQEPAGEHLDQRASLFSGKLRSAAAITKLGNLPALSTTDLREHAGVAAVGDWAAINAEREYGTAGRGAAHTAVWPAG